MARRMFAICAAVILAACALPTTGRCAGGVYVDNITVSNNGATVYQDKFLTANLVGWTKLTDATVVTDPANNSLLINRHGQYAATAYHGVSIDRPEVVTVSMLLFVAPREQQYQCRKGYASIFYITLYSTTKSGQRNDELIKGAICQNPCETGCRVGFAPGGGYSNAYGSKTPVLATGKWVGVTLKIDAAAGTASMIVGDTQVASMKYSGGISPIMELSLISQFGDGSKR